MNVWQPLEHPDHFVELDDKGEPKKVIKGNLTLRKLIQDCIDNNPDLKTDTERDRLKAHYRV